MAEVFRGGSTNRCSKRNKRRKSPQELVRFLNSFYGSYEEDSEIADEEKEDDRVTSQADTAEDLQEEIETLKEEIDVLQEELAEADREKKKELNKKLKALQKKLSEKEYTLGLKSIYGKLNILLNNKKIWKSFINSGFSQKAQKNCLIPFSWLHHKNQAKDNSGEYVYKKEANSELMLDEHGHLVIDHDLDFIADKFTAFAKKQRFYFWKDSYKYDLSELPMAAEPKAKYGRK